MKFKSIFQKLLVYSVIVNIIGMALLAAIINYSLKEMLFKKKETALFHQADQILTIIGNSQDPINDPLFNEFVAYNKKLSKVKIDLLLSAPPNKATRTKKQEEKLLKRADIKNANIINQVLKGKRITHIGTFEKNSEKEVLTVGVPVTRQGQFIGALFLLTPIKEVQAGEVSKIIIIISVSMSIPALFALYWLSRRISKPLVQMTHSASSIGKGRFDERITVKSKDEVGQLAQTFNHMADQLETLEKLRKELIRNVSHELRTPLTSVRGFIQGMLEGVISPNLQKKYLTISLKEIERLSKLLNTILDLSAIESGKVILQPVSISWKSLIQSVLDSIHIRTVEKDITLVEHLENPEDLKIKVDPERMKQVIFNLLDNAVRHTPPQGTIKICSQVRENHFEIKIANSGKGIKPDILQYIWEPFFTEESSRNSLRERSGLGLAITKHLIELMGGSISVESNSEKCTTFTILLTTNNID